MDRFLVGLALLIPAFALPNAPAGFTPSPSLLNGTLPYPFSDRSEKAMASVAGFSPAELSAQSHSTSELLRTL